MRYVCALLLIACLAGCTSTEEPQEPYVSAPLPFDPTDEYTLAAWWDNGRSLLHLGDDQTYAIYDGRNRHREPVEFGRWTQPSYAALWLEPYERTRRDRRRVSVGRILGELALTIEGEPPYSALPGPPETVEDRLFGIWRGDPGRLRLFEDMRYHFEPPHEETGPPDGRAIVGHRGTWMLADDAVLLHPDSPNTPPIRLTVRSLDEPVALEGSAGTLHRR